MLNIKRVYEDPEEKDGLRILVDRIWPRGIAKEKAKVDEWVKEIGPSTELRKWFNHENSKWTEFKKKYREELKTKEEIVQKLLLLEQKEKTVTLLYGAKDQKHNQAIVLKKYLEKRQ